MNYLSVMEARERPALRLALSVGVPGPWGEGIKQVLTWKRLPYVPVAQYPSEENADLAAWTGMRNAPVMVTTDGRVAHRWLDMILLADRLAPAPPALPADVMERALAIGILHELCGEDGFGWSRRLLTIAALSGLPSDDAPAPQSVWAQILLDYGVTGAAIERAPARLVASLRMLADRLHAQRREGRRFFVGTSLGAVDIYWACFSQMLSPLPQAVNPMSAELRNLYTMKDPAILAAIDPILMDHRDRVFEEHLGLPLDY